jgi:hypothetical protein
MGVIASCLDGPGQHLLLVVVRIQMLAEDCEVWLQPLWLELRAAAANRRSTESDR